jgi:uncharacterized repeat protein (TIGR01451 family)
LGHGDAIKKVASFLLNGTMATLKSLGKLSIVFHDFYSTKLQEVQMFQSKKLMSILALLLVVGTAFVLSGCASCCGETPSKPASKGGVIRGTMGCDDCEKSSSPLQIDKEMPQQVVIGKPYSYTIKVSNDSQCALEDVVVTERISDKYEMQTATPQPTKTDGRLAQWDLGYLQPKETKLITITGAAMDANATKACTKGDYSPVLCLGPEAI